MTKELPPCLTNKQRELVVKKMNDCTRNARDGWKKSAAFKKKIYIATIPTTAFLLQISSFESELNITNLMPLLSYACATCFAWMWAFEQPIIVPVSIFNNLIHE